MINESSRVLIADDFELVRVMMEKALKELGFTHIEQAENGKETMEKLKEAQEKGQPFSLLFLDWNMPEVDGYEVLTQCRTNKDFENLPIVMITAESERAYVLKALMAGATDYVVKPLSPPVLKEKLSDINKRLATRVA